MIASSTHSTNVTIRFVICFVVRFVICFIVRFVVRFVICFAAGLALRLVPSSLNNFAATSGFGTVVIAAKNATGDKELK